MGGHALADICAQVGDLVVNVGEEREAGLPASFHYLHHVTAVQFHSHCPVSPERVQPNVLCSDALSTEPEVVDGFSNRRLYHFGRGVACCVVVCRQARDRRGLAAMAAATRRASASVIEILLPGRACW